MIGRRTWRDWAVPALIVAATAILVVGCLTVWVRRQALDTPYVVRAGDRMLEDPEIRSTISLYLVDELYRRVDVQADIARVLPERERGLALPAAVVLRGSAPRAVEELLGSPLFVKAWEDAVARAHRLFLRIVDGDPTATRAMSVYLGLRPLLLELAAQLGIEREVAAKLPADAARLPLFSENQIGRLRTAIRVLRWMSIYGLLAALALYGLALWLARGRRLATLLRIGLAITLTGVVVLLLRFFAGTAVVDSIVGSRPTIEPAGKDAWRILSEPLWTVGLIVVGVGLLAVGFALLAGPASAAKRLRAPLAPALVRSPAIAWTAVGLAVAAVLLTMPAIDGARVISRSVLIFELVAGTKMVRRVARAESGSS